MSNITTREPLIGEVVSDTIPRDRAEGADATAICRAAVAWLHTFESAKTRNAHAARLGLPAKHRTWPGAPKPKRVRIDPTTWLPWCAARGINPLIAPRQAVESWLHTQTELRNDGVISENTRRARYDTLTAWYGWLLYERWIDTAPTLDRNGKQRMGLLGRRPSPTRPLTVTQIRALRVAAQHDTAPQTNASPVTSRQRRLRSMLVVEMLSATGIRADELCGLRLRDYRPAAGPDAPASLWIENAKHGHVRTVELPPEVTDILEAYLTSGRIEPPEASATPARLGEVNAGHRADQPLITGDRGQRLHPDQIRHLLQRLAAIPRPDSETEELRLAHDALAPLWSDNHGRGGRGRHLIHPHQLRHSWAVHARDYAGADASVIAAQLGHRSIATSQTYLDGSAARTRPAIMALARIYRGGDYLRAHKTDSSAT